MNDDFDRQPILDAIARLKAKVRPIEPGLSDREVARLERWLAFVFPSELRFFLQQALPTSAYYPPWRTGLKEELERWFERVPEGVLFDVEHSGFWREEWGSRPELLHDALACARDHLASVPRLIPIGDPVFLKCIPQEPRTPGNPIFSIHQTDALHAGRDLGDFLRWQSRPSAEFEADEVSGKPPTPMFDPTYRYIPFWTDLVKGNTAR